MKRVLATLPALLLAALLGSPAPAAKVKTWHQGRPASEESRGSEKSKLHHLVHDGDGYLTLGRRLRSNTELDAGHVWALTEDRAGALYAAAGTADGGKVYRLTAGGKPEVVFTSERAQVLSLAASADPAPSSGAVYAGTGPVAQVVRVGPGAAKVICELPELYVWSLAVSPKDGSILAGTGPHGRVYRVTPDGQFAVFHETRQDHVLSLALTPDGTLFAGTDRTGRVVKIDPRGKGVVVHQAAQSEVRTMLWTPDGLVFGTSATRKKGSGPASRVGEGAGRDSGPGSGVSAAPPASPRPGAETVSVPGTLVSRAVSDKGDGPASRSDKRDDAPSKGTPASPPSTPASGENSVYRLMADGTARELFRQPVLVLALAPLAGPASRASQGFLVGTGQDGQLFEIAPSSSSGRPLAKTEVARLDHGQILSLCQRRDGSVFVGTGDPGRLYSLQPGHLSEGTVTSEVLDAKLVSRWGALRWQATTPPKTAVTVAVRSGNVSEPDETWSDWSEEAIDGTTGSVTAPPARFLQYRARLTTADARVSPTLKSVTIRYATTNVGPVITKLEVPDLSLSQPAGPAAEASKKVKLKWTAQDANEDELSFSVYVKKDGWDGWVLVEDDVDKSELEWDTTTTPSGVYRVKVVASDSRDNPPGEARTAERESEPFIVCHEAPKVALKVTRLTADSVRVEATASSPLARLTAGSYSLDGRKWVNAFPADGLFDDLRESFVINLPLTKPGTHTLVLRVQDAAGNTGAADVVFTQPGGGEVGRR